VFQTHTIETLHAWFSTAGRAGVEDVAVGAGFPTSDGDAIIASVLHPNADRAPGWYEQRDGAEWDALYSFARPFGMFYLLQLHTHPPGYGTRHSPRDDAGAFIDRVGFVSIVLPDFALRGLDLHGPRTTVHERTTRGWRVWSKAETKRRLLVIPSELDLQSDASGAGQS
jgi:hypothetical protein